MMKKFEIEHIGICVKNPVEMANWYQRVLGFKIKFAAQDEDKGVAFIMDSSDKIMLELGKIPNILPLINKKELF
jgi:catechol-2,3-dioxygenase